MTEQDRAGIPAKQSEFRAWHPQTRDVIYLQAPEYIRYHPDYQLQKRDENGTWGTFLLSEAEDGDTHQENLP